MTFFFFFKDKVFFFNIILIIFYFIKGRAEKSFRHFTLTLFFNFIEIIFEIGYYLFKTEGIGISFIFIYGTVG